MGIVVCLLTMQTCSCNTSCKTSYSAATQAVHITEERQILSTGPWHCLELVSSSPGTHQSLPHSCHCRSMKIKPGLSLRAARRCRQESHMDDSTEHASACTAEGSHLLQRWWEAEWDGQEHGQREPPNHPSACESS